MVTIGGDKIVPYLGNLTVPGAGRDT